MHPDGWESLQMALPFLISIFLKAQAFNIAVFTLEKDKRFWNCSSLKAAGAIAADSRCPRIFCPQPQLAALLPLQSRPSNDTIDG